MLQNVHRIEGDVTYISLTRGQEAIIDTSDLEQILQIRWYAELVQRNGDHYARGKPGGGGKSITMHRYLMNAKEGEVVDHINFNTLDNRRENLRIVTYSENNIHQRRKPGQTGLLHITVLKSQGRQSYYVTMRRDGVRKSKSYPYTPEGLQLAQDLVKKWQEDFSYDPQRTTQRRSRRSNLLTATVENGPHVGHMIDRSAQSVMPDFDEDEVIFVPLTRGQRTVIDKTDEARVSKYKWSATPNTMGGYYAAGSPCGYLHRFLLDAPSGMYVDHINHDTLDNRRSNLRLVSNQENNTNRDGAYSTSKTGIRGVSVHKTTVHNGQHGLMYAFRCHCVTCKAAKYFSYTEEGLEEAKSFAEAHYAAMNKEA